MKHAAALALVGWYLIVPPSEQAKTLLPFLAVAVFFCN
jgi:hypothetical protein